MLVLHSPSVGMAEDFVKEPQSWDQAQPQTTFILSLLMHCLASWSWELPEKSKWQHKALTSLDKPGHPCHVLIQLEKWFSWRKSELCDVWEFV